MLRRSWLLFFLTVILTSEGVFIADLIARQSAFNFVASVLPGEIIALTNDERSQNTVSTLGENALLDAAAQAKANDMATKGYFSHVGPDGKEPWAWVAGAGYNYSYAGENLAVHFEDSTDVVNAWMASPTHRANIVKPVYTEIGVGVAQGTYQGQPATFVVQYFGTPRGIAAAVATAPTQNVATAPPASSQVQGAETEIGQPQQPEITAPVETAVTPTVQRNETPWSSFARELTRNEVRPSAAISWILAGIATLLVIGIALAFFIHIQVQATEMLVGGAVVAVIALSLLFLNSKTPFNVPLNTTQSASVFGAMPTSGGFIDSIAASSAQ